MAGPVQSCFRRPYCITIYAYSITCSLHTCITHAPTHKYRDTDIHTYTQRHKHAHIHTETQTCTQRHRHTHIHTETRTCTQRHRHAHRDTDIHTQRYTDIHTLYYVNTYNANNTDLHCYGGLHHVFQHKALYIAYTIKTVTYTNEYIHKYAVQW